MIENMSDLLPDTEGTDDGPYARVTLSNFKRGGVTAEEIELSGDPDSVVRLLRLLTGDAK